MKKLVCATFLIAVSLGAQTGPAAQSTAPAAAQAASQAQPQQQTPTPPVVRESSLASEEARQILLDKGYFLGARPQLRLATPTRCAIPLLQMRVPNKEGSAIRTIPANPSIDPKIVSAPPVPACAPNELPLPIAPSQPAAEKK